MGSSGATAESRRALAACTYLTAVGMELERVHLDTKRSDVLFLEFAGQAAQPGPQAGTGAVD